MSLNNNPTPNEVVKAVKNLETNKQDKLPTTSTAGKVLKSTSTAGTVEWGDSPSGGQTDVKVDSNSITSDGVADLKTINGDYNSSTNKLATASDIPDVSNFVSKTTTAKQVYGTDINGNQTTYTRTDSGMFIQELPNQYNRITDLGTGVYKLTYNGTKYLYYSGTSATLTHTVKGGSISVLLYVNRYSTTIWTWFYITSDGTNATLYYGTTNTTLGSASSKNIGNLLTGISSYVKNNLTYSTSNTTYALSAYQGYLLDQNKENVSNKVTSLSSSSTDTQYPSAKLVYDQLALKQAALPTTSTSGKVLKSTSTAGTLEWGDVASPTVIWWED